VFAGTRQDVDFGEFLLNYWDWDKLEYIAEKLRKNHGIHKTHCDNERAAAERHWLPAFKGKRLGELSRDDIEAFVKLFEGEVSCSDRIKGNGHKGRIIGASRKNNIIRAGVQALRWAHKKGMLQEDITAGIVWYSAKAKERPLERAADTSPPNWRRLFLLSSGTMRGQVSRSVKLAC
jgi:hypothetical protein